MIEIIINSYLNKDSEIKYKKFFKNRAVKKKFNNLVKIINICNENCMFDFEECFNQYKSKISLCGICYFNNNEISRDDDLPAYYAIENYDKKTQIWYVNGVVRRKNCEEPAIIMDMFDEKTMYWFKNGVKHRSADLPAVISSSGNEYWIKGRRVNN